MDSKQAPRVRTFLPASIIMMLTGWGGLYAILTNTTPTGGTRWAFFFVMILALTGTLLPGIAYLHRRFPSNPPPAPTVIVRQSLWVAVYFATLAWLQIGRVLTPALILLLAIGLVLIEWLLRMRERAMWRP